MVFSSPAGVRPTSPPSTTPSSGRSPGTEPTEPSESSESSGASEPSSRPGPPGLVLLEGLPGSGKSTLARHVHHMLDAAGVTSTFVPEGDVAHPADLESVAVLHRDRLRGVLARYPLLRDLLLEHAQADGEDVLVAYGSLVASAPHVPPALVEELAEHDVYLQDADTYRRLTAQRWSAFASSARDAPAPATWVFDCALLQNPITMLMARLDVPEEDVVEHVLHLAEQVRPLGAVVVHLDAGDVRRTMEAAARERASGWFESFVRYHTEQGYGLARGLVGLAGTVEVLQARKRVEAEVLRRLPLEVVQLDVAAGWRTARGALAELVRDWTARPPPA